MPTIETPRLRLVALTLGVAHAMVEGLRPAAEDEWAPDYPTDGALVAASLLVTAAQLGEDRPPGRAFQLVRRDTGRVIGGAGCYPPDEHGVVQVEYSIAPSELGQGLAAEAVRGLVAWLHDQPGVVRVVAETATTNDQGLEVYAAAGMQAAGLHDDLVVFEA